MVSLKTKSLFQNRSHVSVFVSIQTYKQTNKQSSLLQQFKTPSRTVATDSLDTHINGSHITDADKRHKKSRCTADSITELLLLQSPEHMPQMHHSL
jgi:hypothetical protein